MSRIDTVFSQPKRKALVAYVTVGYPTVKSTLEIVPMLAECGCDIVELGIPFSDPLADGATIQEASFQALQAGVTPRTCLEVAEQIRRKTDVPLAFMTYYNPVLRYGLEAFCTACARAGVEGLIVPDLPPDESVDLDGAAQNHGLDLIFLLTPTSNNERIRLVVEKSRGFVYVVSLLGVTGARDSLPAGLGDFIGRIRNETAKPLCVGFGISTPDQAKQVGQLADGIIVGSRLVQLIRDDKLPYEKVTSFVRGLRLVLDK
ncbi:MAG: tryptophan synthase subunit alpha [Dehalococcoidales bacterium]|nr:MAG: tryptophan synthase subunit alpha [Dehalococcoidales bacterium]